MGVTNISVGDAENMDGTMPVLVTTRIAWELPTNRGLWQAHRSFQKMFGEHNTGMHAVFIECLSGCLEAIVKWKR